MQNEIYLDNSATTKPRPEVIEQMMFALTDEYGNPSSMHTKGLNAEKMVKSSRENLSRCLNCNSKQIYFTSGGTEANNIAIRGTVLAGSRLGRHIITSKFEHASVINTYKALENEGYEVTYLDVASDGFVDLEHLYNSINDNTILVSIMHVNSEIGTIQPIREISDIIKSKNKNTKFHVDAVQSFCKIETIPSKLGADLMTFSSHKIHGPKGVGALYIKDGVKVNSLIFGGEQEATIRPGTENIPGIVGFGKAAEIEYINFIEINNTIKNLRDGLQNKILSNIDDVVLNGSIDNRAPHILNMSFLGVRGEVLLHALAQKGIFVSTGSACSSSKNVFSHVLTAMGLSKEIKESAIRFSLGGFNTQDDIDKCIEILIPVVQQLRKFKRR